MLFITNISYQGYSGYSQYIIVHVRSYDQNEDSKVEMHNRNLKCSYSSSTNRNVASRFREIINFQQEIRNNPRSKERSRTFAKKLTKIAMRLDANLLQAKTSEC